MREPRAHKLLHGISLEQIVTSLVEHLGWDELGKRIKLHRLLLAALLLLPVKATSAADRPVVAVFQIQDKESKLDSAMLDKLTEYLGTAIAEGSTFRIIPPGDIREALSAGKKKSFKHCYDAKCQIELGKELAANKTLATSILRIGAKCIVSTRLYDLETQTTDRTAKVRGLCSGPALIESLDAVALKIRGDEKKVDLSSMVHVPGGEFLMGCDPQKDKLCRANEVPQRKIHLDAFFIDKTEVTVAAYRKCVQAGVCSDKGLTQSAPHDFGDSVKKPLCNWDMPRRDQHPMNNVTWFQADDYCKWAGKRLPTSAEFEKASRGTKGQIYPWGNDKPTCERAVSGRGGGCGKGTTWAVASMPKGASPYGALNMSGNVQEWVADWYLRDYYAKAPAKNPKGPESSDSKTLRGGDFSSDAGTLRSAARLKCPPSGRMQGFGFRCAVRGGE